MALPTHPSIAVDLGFDGVTAGALGTEMAPESKTELLVFRVEALAVGTRLLLAVEREDQWVAT